MSSIIRELFAAQMHWVNVFLKLRRIIGTLKAHFPSRLWPGALPQQPYSSDEMPGPTELVLAVGFRTCNTLGFFFFSSLQDLLAWKIPKVTQRLSGKVTKVEASKAPGFHPLCSCPFPGQTRPGLKHTDLAPRGSRRQRHPARGLHLQAVLPLGLASAGGPRAGLSKFSVLICQVGTELLASLPPKLVVKVKRESTVLCNDTPVTEKPFILQ